MSAGTLTPQQSQQIEAMNLRQELIGEMRRSAAYFGLVQVLLGRAKHKGENVFIFLSDEEWQEVNNLVRKIEGVA